MEFILEEIDIKEEDDTDGDPEREGDLISDYHNWKLNPNEDGRLALKGSLSELQIHGSTESQDIRKLGHHLCLDSVTSVHHVDLDVSDMFLIKKTIKVEPADVEINSGDPLALCLSVDTAPESGIDPRVCKLSHASVKNPQKVTQGEKPYKCEVCGMDFARKSDSSRHDRTHIPHKCEVCGKDFARKYDLIRHIMTHTGEKSHTCEVCRQVFTQIYELTRHKLIHTGLKAHVCDVCGEGFNRKREYTMHIMTHTGVRPHKCDMCGKGFIRNSDLTKHRSTHTIS